MGRYEPELYIVDKDGYRWYHDRTIKRWEQYRACLVIAIILRFACNEWLHNNYVNLALTAAVIICGFQFFSYYPHVTKLKFESAYRHRDLEESKKLQASGAHNSGQEPHGPASRSATI